WWRPQTVRASGAWHSARSSMCGMGRTTRTSGRGSPRMTRRTSAAPARSTTARSDRSCVMPATVDVLVPTCNRLPSLVMTLSGVAAQTRTDLRVIVADQSDTPVIGEPVVQAVARVIEARGGAFECHHREALRGIAEQRDFLLRQSTADAVLYLADALLMEPWGVGR